MDFQRIHEQTKVDSRFQQSFKGNLVLFIYLIHRVSHLEQSRHEVQILLHVLRTSLQHRRDKVHQSLPEIISDLSQLLDHEERVDRACKLLKEVYSDLFLFLCRLTDFFQSNIPLFSLLVGHPVYFREICLQNPYKL